MKYWHYLVPYLLMGIVILIDVRNVSYKEDCIRYGQPRVCLIDKPPTRFRGGRGAFSYNYFAIEFTLEDQDSIINESNNLHRREATSYGAPGYGFYRCYSPDAHLRSPYTRIDRWMYDSFVLSYGPVNVSLDGYELE